ncbi:MAG: triose-phosphate isomerase, partial [archaeon]
MFVLVNLKTYPCDPVEVAKAAKEVSDDSGVRIGVAAQDAHLEAVADTGVETWAQHVDPIEYGSNTGHTLAESVADAGAVGTLINHSENRLKLADIDASVEAAERAGLETCVCANNPDQIAAAAALGPDSVAVEPPELIGTGTPVSKADPDIVTDAVEAAEAVDEDVEVYCGAGISTGDDVEAAG